MKKVFPVLLVVLMLFSCAMAETNLSEMSYDELLTLQKDITKEIMTRPEWKEVTVPAGHWKVGVDIPAGTYCIKADTDSCFVTIWRKAIEDYSDNGLFYSEVLDKGEYCGKIELVDNMIVTLENPAVFTPPVSLGF